MNTAKIHIPTPLRQYAGKQATVEVGGATVADALASLVHQHPDLQRHLYTEDGKLRAFVNVYLNDEDIRYLDKEATAVRDSDTISIVPSIAGGREDAEIPDREFSQLNRAATTRHCCCSSCCRR
jgi:molybdopterin converting factor small subunit